MFSDTSSDEDTDTKLKDIDIVDINTNQPLDYDFYLEDTAPSEYNQPPNTLENCLLIIPYFELFCGTSTTKCSPIMPNNINYNLEIQEDSSLKLVITYTLQTPGVYILRCPVQYIEDVIIRYMEFKTFIKNDTGVKMIPLSNKILYPKDLANTIYNEIQKQKTQIGALQTASYEIDIYKVGPTTGECQIVSTIYYPSPPYIPYLDVPGKEPRLLQSIYLCLPWIPKYEILPNIIIPNITVTITNKLQDLEHLDTTDFPGIIATSKLFLNKISNTDIEEMFTKNIKILVCNKLPKDNTQCIFNSQIPTIPTFIYFPYTRLDNDLAELINSDVQAMITVPSDHAFKCPLIGSTLGCLCKLEIPKKLKSIFTTKNILNKNHIFASLLDMSLSMTIEEVGILRIDYCKYLLYISFLHYIINMYEKIKYEQILSNDILFLTVHPFSSEIYNTISWECNLLNITPSFIDSCKNIIVNYIQINYNEQFLLYFNNFKTSKIQTPLTDIQQELLTNFNTFINEIVMLKCSGSTNFNLPLNSLNTYLLQQTIQCTTLINFYTDGGHNTGGNFLTSLHNLCTTIKKINIDIPSYGIVLGIGNWVNPYAAKEVASNLNASCILWKSCSIIHPNVLDWFEKIIKELSSQSIISTKYILELTGHPIPITDFHSIEGCVPLSINLNHKINILSKEDESITYQFIFDYSEDNKPIIIYLWLVPEIIKNIKLTNVEGTHILIEQINENKDMLPLVHEWYTQLQKTDSKTNNPYYTQYFASLCATISANSGIIAPQLTGFIERKKSLNIIPVPFENQIAPDYFRWDCKVTVSNELYIDFLKTLKKYYNSKMKKDLIQYLCNEYELGDDNPLKYNLPNWQNTLTYWPTEEFKNIIYMLSLKINNDYTMRVVVNMIDRALFTCTTRGDMTAVTEEHHPMKSGNSGINPYMLLVLSKMFMLK